MTSIAAIVNTIQVDRPPEAAFAYVTDPAHFPEKQNVTYGHLDGTGAGARCTTRRSMAGREVEAHTRITTYDPPRAWADRGLDGPVRAQVEVRVDPLDDGRRSQVTISVDFNGHGIGRLLVPLVVRRQAAREMQVNMRQLADRLASGGHGPPRTAG